MPEATQRLRKIIADMHRLAELAPGRPIRRELAGGLRVDILIGEFGDRKTNLQISRLHTWPSATEFAVVLNNWPYALPLDMAPDRFVHQERYFLCCSWTTLEMTK